MTKVTAKVQVGFNEPDGTRHEKGETIQFTGQQIPDWEYLVLDGTLEVITSKTVAPDGKPYKPPMETKAGDA